MPIKGNDGDKSSISTDQFQLGEEKKMNLILFLGKRLQLGSDMILSRLFSEIA